MSSSTALSPITTTKGSVTPATPQTPGSNKNTPQVSPSPGNWRHPQWDEIVRRQKAATFDYTNVNRAVLNFTMIIVSFFVTSISESIPLISTHILQPLLNPLPYKPLLLWLARLFLSLNIYKALLPAFTPPDNLTNIDLTATQRRLLGLDPRATPPPTANTKYATPPKYTPRSGSATTPGGGAGGSASAGASPAGSNRSSYSGSPLAGYGAGAGAGSGSGNGSPLGIANGLDWKNASSASPSVIRRQAAERKHRERQQQVLDERLEAEYSLGSFGGGGGGGSGRRSFGMSTPPMQSSGGGGAGFGGSVFAPNTPSPSGRTASVGLSNKWVYERGRRDSGGRAWN